jgi:glycosyltransferase involved in cell wall biosynthesis
VALLEALAVKVPGFCTDVGDIGLILEQYKCGMAIPFSGDIDEYDGKFEEFVRFLPAYRTSLNSKAEAILERFSGENVAKQYASTFEKAMLVGSVEQMRQQRSDSLEASV